MGPEPPEAIVVVSVDVRPATPSAMFLALPNVLLVFRLDRSPDERWKKVFDNGPNLPTGGLLGLIRRIAVRTPDPPSVSGDKIRWAVPSDQVEEAERLIRQRVEVANAQTR